MKTLGDYQKYINREITIVGFVDKKRVKVLDVYRFGANEYRPYFAFRCEVVHSKLGEGLGERENLLCRDVVRNGQLVDSIKVLAR